MTFLLDTNVLIHAQRGHPATVRERMQALGPGSLAISVMTIAELWYGAARQPDAALRHKAWSEYISDLAVLEFDAEAAKRHGQLRHDLRNEPIADRDLIIAATALVNDLVLVTANVREFRRVPGLTVEDWTA